MDQARRRRENLARLIELAQAARGWSRRELARVVGRDPSRLIPSSGVPKLDLVLNLSDVLGWPIELVIERIWEGTGSGGPAAEDAGRGSPFETALGLASDARADGDDAADGRRAEALDGITDLDSCAFAELESAARDAHRDGRYARAILLARAAARRAETPDEAARACNREIGGWDGLGCSVRALDVARHGVTTIACAPDLHRLLVANLAGAQLGLGRLVEASAVARRLVDRYERTPPENVRDRTARSFAHFVAGEADRRLASNAVRSVPDAGATAGRRAARSIVHLDAAEASFGALAAEYGDAPFGGIANTCRGVRRVADVLVGRREARDAVRELADGLEAVIDCAALPAGDRLESYGWWCIAGCAICTTLREREASDADGFVARHVAIFTNKAEEIAERLDNWSLRERVLSYEFQHRTCGTTPARSSHDGDDAPEPLLLDAHDVRIIMGTMGRFPAFRPTGWRMLEAGGVTGAD